jgi:hypothetical protein
MDGADQANMPGKLYVICPMEVRSKHDGQSHFITAYQLVDLYQLPQGSRWVVWEEHVRYPAGAIYLYPRYSGDYILPTEKVEN